MAKIETFMVVHSPNYEPVVILTKNCSQKRAKRLWKKYLKKNTWFSGAYVVSYGRRKFIVKEFKDTV